LGKALELNASGAFVLTDRQTDRHRHRHTHTHTHITNLTTAYHNCQLCV